MTDTALTSQAPSAAAGAAAGRRVSVIIPTFNRAHYIGECLDSLLAQSVPPHEILVIDDGSSDGTAELIARYAPPVRYQRKENGGKPSAVNLGLTLASGDFVWVFDDDDVALPDAIASRLALFEQDPSLDYVYSPHKYGHGSPDSRIAVDRSYEPPAYEGQELFRNLMTGCFFSFSSCLVRRSAFEELGGLNETLLSSEDYDMALRLAQHKKGRRCDTPSFIVREHGGLRGAATIRYAAQDRAKIFRKFDQAVGRRLRRDVPLERFAGPQAAGSGSAEQRGAALLARAAIMGSKACLDEMLDDLAQLGHEAATGQAAWPPGWRQTLARAVCDGYTSDAMLADWGPFSLALRAKLLDNPQQRATLRAMAAGFRSLALGYPGPLAHRLRCFAASLRLLAISLQSRSPS